MALDIELIEAAKGVKKQVKVRRHEVCLDCAGSGSKSSKRATCSRCKGRGEFTQRQFKKALETLPLTLFLQEAVDNGLDVITLKAQVNQCRYEIFAEGGGNAFGVEFDRKGRVYSGHNGGNTRGFHYVQGAYYRKGFEKHGQLSNPYAFGFFEAMKHNDAARFSHTFSIYEGTTIGRRCILHSGVVVGSDGYGYATEEGRHHKVPQIGSVRIEDDVEIGSNTTIDRGTIGETVVGEGTKIDNLVQIGHGVKIGKHCLLVAQVGIAGSTELGDYVVVAGQSGFSGHLKIGNRVQVAAKSAVLGDVPDDAKVMGSPAMPFRDFARREALLKRLMKKKPSP